MAINLRGVKQAPLTHDELDQNFREFFYSGSVNSSEIKLFRSQSIDPVFSIPFTTPNGLDKFIQIKSGSDLSGSGAVFTGSQNFTFDYDNNIFEVTGSSNFQGNINVDGNITATSFITTTVSSSVILSSGSTVFGDTRDDTHRFTGSLISTDDFLNDGNIDSLGTSSKVRFNYDSVSNLPSATIYGGMFATVADEGKSYFASESGDWTPLANSESFATNIAALKTDSGSFSTRVTALEEFSSSLDDTYATDVELNTATQSLSSSLATGISASVAALSQSAKSAYLLNTTDTFTGDLTVTGTLTSTELVTNIVSSSITLTTGSNIFGDQLIDTHEFTGSVTITSSLDVDGILSLPNITNVSQSLASAVAGAGIQNIVEDTSPELGGKLALNGEHFSGSLVHTGSAHFSGSVTASGELYVDGLISASGDIIAFATSDERLKDNITPIEGALDKINQIGGYEFDWNSDSEHSGHDVGVIAQEIEAVLPEVVAHRKNGYLAVRYEKIVALLINAIKEQQLQIDELKSKL